tara:strand:- start:1195 stop:1779 length:585 start_codon:yes stop_codon:yes gene_type:complete
MAKERKAYAPFSLTSEAGVAQTPVEGYIDVVQKIFPSVTTGSINENGTWAGIKSNDTEFIGLTRAEGLANGGTALFPDTNSFPSINMNGFKDLAFAFKPTNGGNYILKTVMGPDTTPYANLTPVNSGANLSIVHNPANDNLVTALNDTLSAGANVWNIVTILDGRCKDQLNMQISIENSSGDVSTIEFGFMRLI